MAGDISVDVAVLGGGITGIVAAHLLKEAGLKVAVIESGRVAMDVTGNTTAKITSLHGVIYDFLIEKFGREKARQYAEANQQAIGKIAALVDEKNIDCNFERIPAYTYSQSDSDKEQLRKEAEAALSLGLPASYVENLDVPFPAAGAVSFQDQALFHPRKFLLDLASSIEGDGSHIFEHTQALNVDEDDGGCEVETTRGEIKAKDVIIATHYPFLDRGFYFARLYPRASYALGVRVRGPVLPGLYYGISEPNYSIRPYPGREGDMLIIGGYEHKTGHADDTLSFYEKLEQFARSHFDVASIDYHWTTQDNETPDKVPYVGKFTPFSKHTYVATGYGGWGMTNGVAAAMILSDMVQEKDNPWKDIFDPSRFKVTPTAKTLAMENLEVGKKFFSDRLQAKMKDMKIEDLEPGQGEIIRTKGEDLAVYKDDQGKVHAVSPKCTHMGCYVHWNNAERTWDCPCHGSRFNHDGQLLHGPALKDLEKKEIGE